MNWMSNELYYYDKGQAVLDFVIKQLLFYLLFERNDSKTNTDGV